MNLLKGIASPTIYIEIGHSSMKVVDGDDGLELSLERVENGRLTPGCAERLTASLRVFLKKHLWRNRLQALCAIGARGVSLRRLALPGSPSDDELERMLPLQIEREFPLVPEELAWGYCRLGRSAGMDGTEVLVAAVKKDAIEDYNEIFRGCGISATYTLAAFATGSLCAGKAEVFSILDIGRNHSELTSFRNARLESVRVFAWGGESVTRAIEKKFGVPRAEAEKWKISGVAPAKGNGAADLPSVIDEELDRFVKLLPSSSVGDCIYLTGGGSRLSQAAGRVTAATANGTRCQRLETSNGEGHSAAIVALRQAEAQPQLILRPGLSGMHQRVTRPAGLRWVIIAALLSVGCLSVRYAEAFLHKPRLVRQLADVKAYRETLPRIERELSFFEFLRTNQPAYLEPLFALANAAPSGTKIESITLNKRGDLALRATMKNAQQLTDLRARLIQSGLFASVVVEEQTPSSDRQKLSVRMSGQWKPLEKAAEPAAPTTVPRNASGPGSDSPSATNPASPNQASRNPSPS